MYNQAKYITNFRNIDPDDKLRFCKSKYVFKIKSNLNPSSVEKKREQENDIYEI